MDLYIGIFTTNSDRLDRRSDSMIFIRIDIFNIPTLKEPTI